MNDRELSSKEIQERIPGLHRGNFRHWSVKRAGLKPARKVRNGNIITYYWPEGATLKIMKLFENKRERKTK